ncbi:MAG: hypothetical protein AB7E75_03450 [Candidatus Methanomethylophilaceae archaeon]
MIPPYTVEQQPIGGEHRIPLTPAEIAMREEAAERRNRPWEPSDGRYELYPVEQQPIGGEHRIPLTPAEIAMREEREFEWIYPEITIGLSQLTNDERYILSRALQEPGDVVNIPVVLNGYSQLKKNRVRTKDANYQALYRAFQRLKIRGLVTLSEQDGLVSLHALRPQIAQVIRNDRATRYLLDKGYLRNSNRGKNPSNPEGKRSRSYDYLAIPKNASGRRLAAINYLHGVNMLDYADRNLINSYFASYDDEVSQKIIALISNDGEIIGSQYSTRFNDIRKAAISLKKFDHAVDVSLGEYRKAVFLTLTTDPKLFKNLWEANRSFGKSWNKFLSFITKKFGGKRPKYINAFEYTKSGLMHCHAIIFVDYLMDVKKISEEWLRIGQAKIVYIYALHNQIARGGKSRQWQWLKTRPVDPRTGKQTKMRCGTDYLKKYLKKATLAMTSSEWKGKDGKTHSENKYEIQSLYWAHNKRFWTSSRSLLPQKEEEEIEIEEETEPKFAFLGVFWEEFADEVVDRMIYWRGGENPDIDYGLGGEAMT